MISEPATSTLFKFSALFPLETFKKFSIRVYKQTREMLSYLIKVWSLFQWSAVQIIKLCKLYCYDPKQSISNSSTSTRLNISLWNFGWSIHETKLKRIICIHPMRCAVHAITRMARMYDDHISVPSFVCFSSFFVHAYNPLSKTHTHIYIYARINMQRVPNRVV